MTHVQLWPVGTVLGVLLLGIGLVYGLARGGGGKRIGDAAADAGAKADVSPAARGWAIGAVAVGILLLLGSGITAWQYEARSGGHAANDAAVDHITRQDTTAELNASVTTQAPRNGVKTNTDPRAAQQSVDAASQMQAQPSPPASNG